MEINYFFIKILIMLKFFFSDWNKIFVNRFIRILIIFCKLWLIIYVFIYFGKIVLLIVYWLDLIYVFFFLLFSVCYQFFWLIFLFFRNFHYFIFLKIFWAFLLQILIKFLLSINLLRKIRKKSKKRRMIVLQTK